jgi:FKBP-type peptidyl-prolyl cis-trans isomerase FklB
MKRIALAVMAFSLITPLFADEKPPQLKDLKDKASYSFGLNIGLNMRRENVDVNPDVFLAGLKDGLASRRPLLTEQEVRETMMAFQKEMQDKQAEQAKKNSADGEKFLAENKNKEGIRTTASGLQYKALKEGNGAQPKVADTVTVNYRGTLLDGTEFDSSYKRGQPATFPVTGVIKGWTEALQLMKVGSKFQLFIPANLAYGDRSPGVQIPPGSMLIFEVELLDVKSPSPGASAAPSGSP